MKKKILLLMSTGLVLLFLMQSYTPPPPPSEYDDIVANYDQQPPIALNYWVQKLADTLATGENMIMRIEYQDEGVEMPDNLKIYLDDRKYLTFRDDGNYPDSIDNDKIYAAYLKENISSFLSTVYAYQKQLQGQGTFLKFTGHVGEQLDARRDLTAFDFDGFNNGVQVQVDALLINAINCGTSLLKQNSLFITDINVVESASRTFKYSIDATGTITESGNKEGNWTFGKLIKNIVNNSSTGITTKEFLKRWLRRWTSSTTINGQTVASREDVIRHLIQPWLTAANNKTPNFYFGLTIYNWENIWDDASTTEERLLQYAPFKLTAIVNRLDLMANIGYAGGMKNAGETRFIFTLISPYNVMNAGGTAIKVPAGSPPKGFPDADCSDLADWEGMNVILEYGNPFSNRCDLRNFAQQWLDLSGETLGSTTYNDHLEAITSQVTNAGVAPNKPNGSALDQIRTNERIFFVAHCGGGPSESSTWDPSNWQLSQFELDNSHYLVPAPVTNSFLDVNNASNIYRVVDNVHFPPSLSNPIIIGSNAPALTDWAFLNKFTLHSGNHQIPLVYSYSSYTMKRAAVAELDLDQSHYWDLDWVTQTTYYNNPLANNGSQYPYAQEMRRQLSLNTCQGCHGGETKTLFTMVSPLAYGQSANYWGATPTEGNLSIGNNDFMVDKKQVDDRFVVNAGQSKVNGSLEYNHLLTPIATPQWLQRVSPFLTGRRYSGTGSTGTWEDDLHNSTADPDDDDPGLLSPVSNFYVYDPADNHDGITDNTFPGPNHVNGYNDLQMRKLFLCKLLNSPCNKEEAFSIMGPAMSVMLLTNFQPLPKNGH